MFDNIHLEGNLSCFSHVALVNFSWVKMSFLSFAVNIIGKWVINLNCEKCRFIFRLLTTYYISELKSLSHVRLFATPWTVAYQAPLSMGFSRQEYWSGLPFPSPEDLPDPGIEPGSPTQWADALPSEPPGKSTYCNKMEVISLLLLLLLFSFCLSVSMSASC